jgi:23S rRNA (pseudouridine1915-N3)-methyltransferase
LKLVFLTVSNPPEWLQELTANYQKKLSYWAQTELLFLKTSKFSRDAKTQKKSEENSTILKNLRDDDYVILCDELGRRFKSKEFAGFFEKIMAGGKKRIVVVIGGAYGFNEEIIKKANLTVSLSDFTLNHHLAFATMCEQTYRVMTIIKGVNYHNE